MNVVTVTFVGHRTVKDRELVKRRVYQIVEDMIVNHNARKFLFGSKSKFDDLCYDVVTELKENYPYIERIYVRGEYPYIDEDYRNYLLESYEDTYYPSGMEEAGRAAYVERNCKMIDESDVCVMYYNENYLPPKRKDSRRELFEYQPKSGTKFAYDYATKKHKSLINVAENIE